MGVHVLSSETGPARHLRSLPRLPGNSHYSVKPMNIVKHSRALPTVPNSKVDPTAKVARALPRVPKQPINFKGDNTPSMEPRITKPPNTTSKRDSNPPPEYKVPKPPGTKKLANTHVRNHRVLPEVPKDENTSGSSGTSTPRATRALPKLPKLQKPKPDQNRIEYMHEVYRKEGDYHSEAGQWEAALKSYNLALKFISDDKATIIARSRVHLRLGKPRKAMQDADLALKLDPIYYEGLLQKAELLLEQGDYENALQYFQKGARMRPDKEGFHEGIERARHAIADTHKARKRKNTVSPEDVSITVQKRSKEKSRKNQDNANMQIKNGHVTMVSEERHSAHRSSARQPSARLSSAKSSKPEVQQESSPMSTPKKEAPPVPVPPPHPPTTRRPNGRQQTPLPGRLKMRTYKPHETVTEVAAPLPASEEEVDEGMMKQILGRMYTDKDYLEKLLEQTDIAIPNRMNIGTTAEGGLHFLYDKVLNWVREGQIHPPPQVQPTPLPRETKASLTRRSLAHGSSVESIVEEQERENERRLKKRKKKKAAVSKAPHSWYQYLEHKKAEEAQERKQYKSVFLHVVEGHKISPKDHSGVDAKRSHGAPEVSKRTREGKLRREKEFDSKESLSAAFKFQSYRPGSDLRGSHSLETEHEDSNKTPPRKLKKVSRRERHASEQERRRAAFMSLISREMEEVEIAYAEGRYDDCTEKASECLSVLEREELPDKHAIVANLHSFLGNAAIGRKDYEGGLKHHNIDLDLGEKHNIDEAISRALGNLGRIYVVQKRHQEALDVFLRKTPMCTSRIETAWLFHEIGNCFLALGDFEYAKDSAKKSLEAAEEAVEWSYQLQSCVLMGVAEVKLKQYHAAFNTFERALEQARLQGDEKAEEAIREAIMDVNDRIVEEMKIKGGPMDFPGSRSDAITSLSRDNSSLAEYTGMGLSRSRAEIAKMQAAFGYRNRADYAKSRAAHSDYSSIYIPDDDGSVSLAETPSVDDEFRLNFDRMGTSSTLLGSQFDFRDNIRSETFVSHVYN